jgi:L-ascorbate metabolism protein UlaG (beta-lactamase superfamily)
MRAITRALLICAVFVGGLFAAAGQAQPMQGGKTELLWLGQAAFRITSPGGKVILIDPWITTNPKTPAEWKDLSKLGKIDVVLVTHGHGDHVGDGPAIVKAQNIKLWGPAGLNDTFLSLGILTADQAPRMNKGGTIAPLGPGISITQTRAEHSSEYVHMNNGKRETHVGGEPVGFIIRMENGFTIYHMGDTGLFADMTMIADRYRPDLILIPIGGHFVMDPQDAAHATRILHPKYAIPMHYGTIPQLAGTPEQYKAALQGEKVDIRVLNPGDRVVFEGK